jgi:hypothetical protein
VLPITSSLGWSYRVGLAGMLCRNVVFWDGWWEEHGDCVVVIVGRKWKGGRGGIGVCIVVIVGRKWKDERGRIETVGKVEIDEACIVVIDGVKSADVVVFDVHGVSC